MAAVLSIGQRIELISMDPHFHDISIGLYRRSGDRTGFTVHSYSTKDGAAGRISFIRKAMCVLGGMTDVDGLLSFPCGAEHRAAVSRVFLEAGKLESGDIEAKPLQNQDRKSGLVMKVSDLGQGLYQVDAEGDEKTRVRRIKVVANGLAKLGEATLVEGRDDQIQYECRQDHHALTGLLLVRAPNVRALVREQEMAMSRGVLAAPSQQ